ncbi:MAG: nitroreductase family protein [Candidatus Neomarinimicrobiota bacterium]
MSDLAAVFSQPVIQIIRQRSSQRSYSGEPLNALHRAKISVMLNEIGHGPFGNRVRFSLVSMQDENSDKPVKLGTYGFISGARDFIVGTIGRDQNACEDYGYLLERIILQVTDWGLGTCWLGGSFNKSAFARAIDLAENEIIPAVTPIGYTATRRTLRDQVIRLAINSKVRKPWSEIFFNQTFAQPLTTQAAGEFVEVLEMVHLAPSASNKQPWRILKTGEGFHFFLRRTPGYGSAFKADLQKVDMGIALSHFELTAREMNLPGCWKMLNPELSLPDDWIYTVSWEK